MTNIHIKKLIQNELGWKIKQPYPAKLKKYRWHPKYLFYEEKNKKYIAVDIIYGQQISRRIYENEVARAQKENDDLEICLITIDGQSHEKIERFCKELGFGLKVYRYDVLNTIIPLTFEKMGRISRKARDGQGWFPAIILNELKTIEKLKFKDELVRLAIKLEKTTNTDTQLVEIKKSIDVILKSVPYVPADSLPFMSLSYFENLLNCSKIAHTDHVFHSIRVFFIGCIIIDKFHDKFIGFYKQILNESGVNVEYMWLLTSLFHDIGRITQGSWRRYLVNPEEKNPDFKEKVIDQMREHWKKPEYKTALANLVELIIHSTASVEDRDMPFTGNALDCPTDEKIANIFVNSYNNLESHGVISCFELCADLLSKMKESNINRKTFLLYHVFPAVLAISFHDFHIWEDLFGIGISPIKIQNFPLAALLIYIDTWDDYKRSDHQKIEIEQFHFDENGVTIEISWFNQKEFQKKQLEYKSFEKHVNTDELPLIIKVTNSR